MGRFLLCEEPVMKLVARTIAALALVAFATPALPCGAEKSTHTAKADTDSAAPAQQPGATVAKAEKTKKADRSQKAKRSAQSAAATN